MQIEIHRHRMAMPPADDGTHNGTARLRNETTA